MKVEQVDGFRPVVITLETLDDFLELRRFLLGYEDQGHTLPPKLGKLLEKLLVCRSS